MTRSIFDPTGPDVEHSGTRNLGPEADNISHMPPDVIDGNVEAPESGKVDEDAQTEVIARAENELEREEKRNPDAT